ncbi:hypothetical protein E5288_WYG016828 [Bos mutus]|uniref:EGF-like domain-containing protein n=1 Tax=Bos mutus TaxID=72004 RepID=A0A6B0SBV1_9CETA|nr:hypothetical protein [Bos mutus]
MPESLGTGLPRGGPSMSQRINVQRSKQAFLAIAESSFHMLAVSGTPSRSRKSTCEPGCKFAMCEPGCKFGECVGLNKCICFPRYTRKPCSQDVNECGFKPRPCQHRCVNTHGSYKCFCLSSHMLLLNATCSNNQVQCIGQQNQPGGQQDTTPAQIPFGSPSGTQMMKLIL